MTTKNPVFVSKNSSSSNLSRLALLAGAAAALPLAASADSIIYSGPKNIVGDANAMTGVNTIDVDGNSASAFTFTATSGEFAKDVYVTPSGNMTAYLAPNSTAGTDPTPLSEGQEIGSSGTYATGNGTLSKTGIEYDDYNWPANGTPAFLGVTFKDTSPSVGTSSSGVYYGWIEVGAQTNNDDATYDILGWAYYNNGDSIEAGQIGPNQFVQNPVPEPSSLALLSLGAAGLLALRARRRSARA